MEKKLYAIYHNYDEADEYGDSVYVSLMVGVLSATEQEIKEFLDKWDKPEVYDTPYDSLVCHSVRAEEIKILDISSLQPYSTDPNNCFNRGITEQKAKYG